MALPSKTSGEACAAAAPDGLPAVMKAVTRGSAGVFTFDDSYSTPVITPKEVLVEIKAAAINPVDYKARLWTDCNHTVSCTHANTMPTCARAAM